MYLLISYVSIEGSELQGLHSRILFRFGSIIHHGMSGGFHSRKLNIRMVVCHIHVEVTFLLAHHIRTKESLVVGQVSLHTTLTWSGKHFIFVLVEGTDRHVDISNVILDVSEAPITQLRSQTRLPVVTVICDIS